MRLNFLAWLGVIGVLNVVVVGGVDGAPVPNDSQCWGISKSRKCKRDKACYWNTNRNGNGKRWGCIPNEFCGYEIESNCLRAKGQCEWKNSKCEGPSKEDPNTSLPTQSPTWSPIEEDPALTALKQYCQKHTKANKCNRDRECRWFRKTSERTGKMYGCIPSSWCSDFSQTNCAKSFPEFCQWDMAGNVCEIITKKPTMSPSVRPTKAPLPSIAPTTSPLPATPMPTFQEKTKENRPNILYMLLDDWREVQYPGASPNIDRLKEEGTTTFTNAYANFPQCGPSRASIMTGKYPFRTGIFVADLLPPKYQDKFMFIPKFFKQRGYDVGMAGKVFHTRGEFYPSHWFTEDDTMQYPRSGNMNFPFPACGRSIGDCYCNEEDNEDWSTCRDYLTKQKVVRWIKEWANTTKPWIILGGFIRPHNDFRYAEWVKDEEFPVIDIPRADTDNIPPIAMISWARDPCAQSWGAIIACLNNYIRAVRFVDRYVGEILDTLVETNQYDNTLIVFSSDHGMQLGTNFQHWAKWTLFDASLRVPLYMKPPKSSNPVVRTVDRVVELIDVFPTLIEYSKWEATSDMSLDGSSLAPLLHGIEGKYTKDKAISVVMTCDGYKNTKRKSPCTTRNRGGTSISGMGISVRTDHNRTTEWRKTTSSASACRRHSTKEQCDADRTCIWLQFVFYPEDELNADFHCIPNPGGDLGINWDANGIIAKEFYDNTEKANLNGLIEGNLMPDIVDIYKNARVGPTSETPN